MIARALNIGILAACLLQASHANATVARYQQAVRQQAGLVSYYTFDNGDAADSAGSNNGTAQGAVVFGPGIGGSAHQGLSLPGSAHVKLGQVQAFDFAGGTGSVESWVRAGWSSIAYNPCLFADRNGGPVNWSIHMNSDKRAVGMWNGTAYQTMAIPSAGTNWHHFAVVFSEGSMSMYWDGSPLGSIAQAPSGDGTPTTQLGSSAQAPTAEGWSGSLDEVAFYSEALTAESVKAHYEAYLAGDPPVISSQPKGGVFLKGNPFQMTVAITGTDISYQWYKGGAVISGATGPSLGFASLAAGDAGTYMVKVSNAAGTVSSDPVTIAISDVLPARLLRYQSAVSQQSGLISSYSFDHWNVNDGFGSNNGTAQGAVTYGAGVGGDAALSLSLSGNGHVRLGQVDTLDFYNGAGAIESWICAEWSSAGSNPCLFADRDNGPVNWSIHMNSDKKAVGMWNGMAYKTFTIPDAGSNWHHAVFSFDAGEMTLYWDGVPAGTLLQGFGPNPEAPTQLGSSGDAVTAEGWIGRIDEVAFYSEPLAADAVRAHYNALMAGDPPTITQEPRGGSFMNGNSLQLAVQASGADLTYQWYKDNTAMQDATNSILTFASLSVGDNGSYLVKVANPSGSVSSMPALVQVVAPDMAAYRSAVRNEASLISLYTFDNSEASDSKGSNTGIVEGNAAFDTGLGGGSNKALILDGSGFIGFGPVSDFDFAGGTGTVEAWIRPDWTTVGYNPCLIAARDGNSVSWSVHMNSGREALGNWNGASYFTLPLSGNLSGWHHFAIAFGKDQWSLYLDGEALGTVSQSIAAVPTAPTQIGSVNAAAPAEGWVGGVDEVAFYREELGAASIRSHYQRLFGSPPLPPSITYRRSGSQLILSWPSEALGYNMQAAVLESADRLSPGLWQRVAGVSTNSVTVDCSQGMRFYRLRL